MKFKKPFCPKSTLFKRSKKAPPNLEIQLTDIKRWQLIEGIKNLHQKSNTSITDGSFHNAIKPALIIGQCFGAMPVSNVISKYPSSLKFTWKSLQSWYAIFVTLSVGWEALLTIYWTFSRHLEFGKMVYLVFYVSNFMSFVCFFSLATNWPDLMMLWHNVEKQLPPYRSKSEKFYLRARMRNIVIIILMLSLIEHILSIISALAIVVDCPRIKNIMKAYYVKSFPQVFSFLPYSTAFGIYIKFIHVTSTFMWTFTDLFIMMISCGLSEKFKLINERMLEDKGKFKNPEYWSEYRRHYRSVCDLVAIIDDKISFLTILSISNNLFFICVQLLNSME
ncbi:hypothetical protein ACKWTF_009450 [Chironomus riparius]